MPQGSVLGPLFFLIYINGLPLGCTSDVKLIADDTYNANVFEPFLNKKCQWVVLNGQFSVWKSVTPGLPHGSVLDPLFFHIYINGLLLGLTIDVKLIADDTYHASVSVSSLNNDLVEIWDWAFNWKMPFNPDRTKQAKEADFFWKKKKNSLYSSDLIF